MFENTTTYPQKSCAVIGRFLLFTNMEAEWNGATMFNFIKFYEENWFLYDTRDGNISYLTRSSADADNRLDAFSGQSRSTNMVPFHM